MFYFDLDENGFDDEVEGGAGEPVEQQPGKPRPAAQQAH